ncbi:MAG: hypothetical protein A07HR60_00075 [uncultured archaeon A07HR60]|nr:MAG: hypothetical protein A07HR60_00075 [uncultured archaeon A07HR60]
MKPPLGIRHCVWKVAPGSDGGIFCDCTGVRDLFVGVVVEFDVGVSVLRDGIETHAVESRVLIEVYHEPVTMDRDGLILMPARRAAVPTTIVKVCHSITNETAFLNNCDDNTRWAGPRRVRNLAAMETPLCGD